MRPAWTRIFPCPGSPNDLESSSPATTPNGHSTNPPRSRSATFAGRNGWTTSRRSKEWLKKDASPERSRRNAGKLWNSDSKSAERQLQHVLPSMGYRVEYRPAFLKEQEREEKTVLLDKQVQPEQKQRLPHFKHWLGKCNPYLANLWRFCKRIAPGVEVRQYEFPSVGTQASPYAANRNTVKKRFPEKMDESRLDAAIALYMHCAGYTVQDVANELYRHPPRPPPRAEP